MAEIGTGIEGPLAEYNTLRQEMDSRSARQHQIFTAQLTIAGAIFSFALSDPRRTLLLLIVPVISYLLASRHATQSHDMFLITRYIREELSDRVPGGLRWDTWLAGQPRRRGPEVSRLPLLLAFSGVAFAAVAWTAPDVLTERAAAFQRAGVLLVWIVGVILAGASVLVFANVVRAYRRWWWPTARTARAPHPQPHASGRRTNDENSIDEAARSRNRDG
jgi:hypothetical protein